MGGPKMIENLIHRRRAERNLTNGSIAVHMSGVLKETVSPEAVGHYFTGNAGIPLEKLGAFLSALGLRIVRDDEKFISPDKLAALHTLAKEALLISKDGADARKTPR